MSHFVVIIAHANDLALWGDRASAGTLMTKFGSRMMYETDALRFNSVVSLAPNGYCMLSHYSDVILGAMSSQIPSLTIVYSTVYSGADQRKHQSFASLAFVWGIHRGPVTRKMFPFDDVIMTVNSRDTVWSAAYSVWSIRTRHRGTTQLPKRGDKWDAKIIPLENLWCCNQIHTDQGCGSRCGLTKIGIPII